MSSQKPSINSFISDTESLVKALFEEGMQEDISECRKHSTYLFPYKIPCPIWYQGFSDWTNTTDKIFELECEAKVKLAFNLAYKIKEKIDFYDLICATMANITTFDVRKFFINEVLRHTSSDELRDHFAEELYRLNESLNKKVEHGIAESAYPLIKGLGKLYRKGKLFEFNNCLVKITNADPGLANNSGTIIDISFEEIYAFQTTEYPLYRAELRLYGVTKFNYEKDLHDICACIDIVQNNGILTLRACHNHKSYWSILACECEKIEVLSFNISVERNPYEDKAQHHISIYNNTKEDVYICFNEESSSYLIEQDPYSMAPIFIPNEKFDEIVILPNGTLRLSKEISKNESEKYSSLHLSSESHPGNMIKYCRIGCKSLSRSQLIDNANWSIRHLGYSDGEYAMYDHVLLHEFTFNDF